MKPKTQGLIAINVAAVIFGAAALYGKLNVSPFWIVAIRSVYACFVLAGVCWVLRSFVWPSRALIPSLLWTGAILGVHWVTFFFSVQWAGVAISTLTFSTFPMFTLFIESAQTRRRPRWEQMLAVLAIVIAVGLLVDVHAGMRSVAGTIIGLFSAVMFSFFGAISKPLAHQMPAPAVSLFQNAIIALLFLPLSFITPGPSPQGIDWFWLFLLGSVSTGLMHQLYFYALRRLSASTCGGFVALEPVYAILFAAVLFNETISPLIAISAPLIVAASFVLARSEPIVTPTQAA